jgi:antitoxin component of MazEF toxin-antitoxin module
MLTLPPPYLKETGLSAGSSVSLEIKGDVLAVRPAHPRLSLKDIIKGTPKTAAALRAKGWDALTPAGHER